MEPNFFRVSVKGLVIKDGKYLLCRESNGLWEMLGGGLDFDEDPTDGLKREIKEETGLEVTWVSRTPIYFLTVKRLNQETYTANVIYEIKLKSLDFTPTDECKELKFFSATEMKHLTAYPNIPRLSEIILRDEKAR